MSDNSLISSTNPETRKDNAKDPTLGIYLGEVIDTKDLSRTGKIKVFVAALNKDKTNTSGRYDCMWSSPFAGGTDPAAIGGKIESYEQTQKSYGMWMVPPDIGNMVLVCFADGNLKFPFIIGCLFPDRFNYMVPGMANGTSYSDSKLLVPVAEKNKRDERTTHNDAIRPIHVDLAQHIVKQGLIGDRIRGAGSSSSRRESPSEVFGILTPGPRDPGNFNNRLAGHQFVMDDRIGSRMIRLRTAGAQQILLHDDQDLIYIINKSGTWVEINGDTINLYSKGSINMRTRACFNLRADQDINIEAGQNLNLKAAGDNITGSGYKGIVKGNIAADPKGSGGSINIEAAKDINQFAMTTFKATSLGSDIHLNAAGKFNLTSTAGISMDTKGPFVQKSLGPMGIGASKLDINGGASIIMFGTTIDLNGPPAIIPPVVPAVAATRIATSTQKDQPMADPVFNADNAKDGKPSIPLNGNRPTDPADKYDVDTIVPALVTAEPYLARLGKAVDPKLDDALRTGSDPGTAASTAPGESNTPGKPADVVDAKTQTTKVGVDYKTPGGQPSPGSAGSSGSAAANSATKSAEDFLRRENARLERINNSIPTYAELQNVLNNYAAAAQKKLIEATGIKNVIKSIETAIPPIRFPISNAVKDQIVGVQRHLKEYEGRLKQLAIDAKGLTANLNADVFKQMRSTIDNAFKFAKNAEDLANKLKEAGVTVLPDGTGLIYEDQFGNKIVDFNNGLGPTGTSLALAADLNTAYERVKGMIKVPLTDNQVSALSSFALAIGAENFANSNVLAALNEGKYSEIPRLMKTWNLGADISGAGTDGPLVYREDLEARRIYEGELFQTPDEVDTSPPPGLAPGDVGFLRLAQHLANVRAEYIRQKINEFGFS